LQVVQRSPLGKTLGRDRMQFNLEIAVAKYQGMNAATANGGHDAGEGR